MKTTTILATKNYKPLTFFVLTFSLTWISWFLSAYFSFQENGETLFVLLIIQGLISPFLIALWMIYSSGNSALKKEFISKLTDLRRIKISSIPAMLLIMPFAVVCSIFISTFFGESWEQFQFSEQFSFSAGFVPVLLVLFLAASFEELGWRSYAMDSLRQNVSYFKASLLFGVLWAFWHLPLYFIKDYYQYELLQSNVIFALNFMISVIPLAIIISWVCEKNQSSIVAAVFFHFFINLAQEALEITQVTKCIETVVLILIAGIIVLRNKKMFFDKPQLNSGTR